MCRLFVMYSTCFLPASLFIRMALWTVSYTSLAESQQRSDFSDSYCFVINDLKRRDLHAQMIKQDLPRTGHIQSWKNVTKATTSIHECGELLHTKGDSRKLLHPLSSELKIIPGDRGQSKILNKHPSMCLTKKQRRKNKLKGINTVRQTHTNSLNQISHMSTSWLRPQSSKPCACRFPTSAIDKRKAPVLFCSGCMFEVKLRGHKQQQFCSSLNKTQFSPSPDKSWRRFNDSPSTVDQRNISQGNHDTMLDGIYFSVEAERLCKFAAVSRDTALWRSNIASKQVYRLEKNGCGSGQNRLIVFDDGSKGCVRYRPNIDQIQGEIYSYYLSNLLGIPNVPLPLVSRLEPASRKWSRVRESAMAAQWAPSHPFLLTNWIDNLTTTHMRDEFIGSKRKMFPGMFSSINQTRSDICELLQWSDLIIFDYLTGHLDRLVNMIFNSRWSPGIFSKPVHNLLKLKNTDSLLFLDNESGLLHGYRHLDKFGYYHEKLLKSMCIFRLQTILAVEKLHKEGGIHDKLLSRFTKADPNHKYVPNLHARITNTLQHRIGRVYHHVQTCANTRVI